MQPVYSVDAITYRDDPIWPLVAEGKPADQFGLDSERAVRWHGPITARRGREELAVRSISCG